MAIIDGMRDKIASSQFEFSQHAVDQSIVRHISVTLARRPLHIQCSYPLRPLVKIITLYEPDSQRWVDFKVRRTSDEQ